MPDFTPDHCPESVATPPSGVPVYCPICEKVPLQGKQTVCSPRCRIRKSMAKRRERDAAVRLHLESAIQLMKEVP